MDKPTSRLRGAAVALRAATTSRPYTTVGICILVLAASIALLTPFRSQTHVLTESTWGAGTPSGTWISAFATLRPWWNLIVPEPVIVTPQGGLEPLVVIPRDELRVKPRSTVLPVRSIGYDFLLGVLTAIRSVGTESVVYDFGLFVRFQQMLLVIAWIVVPLGLFGLASRRDFVWRLLLFVPAFLVTLLAKPTKDIFLSQGIIDSSLASPMALLSIPALCGAVWIARKRFVWWHAAIAFVLGGFLGFTALIRGELLLVLLVAISAIGIALVQESWRSVAKFAAVAVVMVAVPIAYGLVNRAVIGHFIPLRMQSGQNLYEPIGQYPNPYGIEYSDIWAENYMKERGIEYVSIEADDAFAAAYFGLLRSDPMLFATNFVRRLAAIKLSLSIVNVWTLPIVLFGLVYLLRRRPDRLMLAVPWIVLCAFVVVCAWLNDAPRIIAPVHFLTNTAIAVALTVLLQRWVGHTRSVTLPSAP